MLARIVTWDAGGEIAETLELLGLWYSASLQ
jgi:hypothetical protein